MFECRVSSHTDGAPLLTLSGNLDINSVTELRNEIRRLIGEGELRIIVDVDGLDYLDSSGLGVLVGALARLREKGGDLTIIVSNPKNRRVFDITKLSYVFPLYDHISRIP
jgi:anti-sigma B factor antagonist